jgi:glycosyltransferase involved in cell wall biosynthesis
MKKKVLIIGPCLSMGGMERAAVNTANSLQNSNIEIVFVALFKKEHFFTLNRDIKLLEPLGFNTKSLSFVKTILWIRNIVKTEKPDTILAFNKLYAALTAFALVGIKIPFFISERSSPLFVWKQPFKTINRIAFWLKPPTGVIAQTSIAASYQAKYFKKSKIQVIPNILRPITLYPEIERNEIILAVGRLGDHLKGFDLLIESFSLLINKTWQLHIAGGDENGQELKELATKLGVLNRITFLGKVKNIDKVYASAGIFVIPSRSEGFPNALAEAMGAGCCSVAFDFTAGPRDMIQNNVSGIIVENGNITKMALAIDKLINNPEKRLLLGQEASKIVSKLSPKVIRNEIIEFLELKK